MSSFDVAFEWLMDSVDPERRFEISPAEPPGSYVIAGINSYHFPTAFRRISIQPSSGRKAEVYNFYLRYFWGPGLFSQLESDEVAKILFEISTKLGSTAAIKILQKALWPTTSDEDGVLGVDTIAAANAMPAESLVKELNQCAK